MGALISVPLEEVFKNLKKLTIADRRLIRSIQLSEVDQAHLPQLTALFAATDAKLFRDFIERFHTDLAWTPGEYASLVQHLVVNWHTIPAACDSVKIMYECGLLGVDDHPKKAQCDDCNDSCLCCCQGSPILHWAARGCQEIVDYLIAAGATVDLKDFEDNTSLYYAVLNEKIQFNIIATLAKHMRDSPTINIAIQAFADREDEKNVQDLIKITQILLDSGADINDSHLYDDDEIPYNYRTPLVFAIERHELILDVEKYVEFLFNQGAEVNCPDGSSFTPLMMALWEKNETLAAMMLSRDANVNVISNGGNSPLTIAAEYMPQFVPTLLELGADPATRDPDGKTYLELLAGIVPPKLTIPDEFEDDPLLPKCSICMSTLTDPVTDSCGHTFDRECITKHIHENEEATCPVSRAEYDNLKLAPNYAVREFIEAYIKSRTGAVNTPAATSADSSVDAPPTIATKSVD